ncbi:MAG TPA: response regulator [Candidatus Polarisedimenticolia bacterium]|nr:response regulator [Candidatus Polarisedimenticolia bacterium]
MARSWYRRPDAAPQGKSPSASPPQGGPGARRAGPRRGSGPAAGVALRLSEERFRSLVAASESIVLGFDGLGALVLPQPAWERYTGQVWLTHRGNGWHDAVHPDDRSAFKAAWGAGCASRQPFSIGGRLWHAPTRFHRYFAMRAIPVLDETGIVREWIGTVADVDEQRRAEESLRRSVHHLRSIFELNQTIRHAEDVDDIHRAALAALRTGLGADRCSVLRLGPDRVLRFAGSIGLSERYMRAVEGHSPWAQGDLDPLPILIEDVEADGSLGALKGPILEEGIRGLAFIPLTYHGRLLGKFMLYFDAPRRLDAGEVQVAQTIAGNVAHALERRRAEQELRHQSHITRTITDNAASALFMLDAEGRPTFMNQAAEAMTGFTLEEMRHRRVHDTMHYVHPDGTSYPADECPTDIACRRLAPLRDHEDVYVRKDGSFYHVSVTVTPLQRDGAPVGAVMEVRDITPTKMAREQLRALNETLEQRVAERTQVAEQQAAQLRLLASELTQTEQRERRRLAKNLHDHLQQFLVAAKLQVGQAHAAVDGSRARHALRRVDELLDESVEASRTLAVELSPPILHDAGLARALEWLARWMEEKHSLRVDVRADDKADPESEDTRVLLFEAVRELLFNVVKHSGTDRAAVSMAGEGEGLVITVEDRGQGFDPEGLRKSRGAVRGFGLFAIRERLEILGGRLEVESRPQDGARFRLHAPLRAAPAPLPATGALAAAKELAAVIEQAPARLVVRKAAASRAGRSIRVLIADDHQIVRQGLIGLLESEPDIVVIGEASHGEEAVEQTRALRPDVVVMDVNMPRMNGIEATRVITRELPDVAVVALSLYEKGDMAATMLEVGAACYLTKDGPSEELIAAIRTARARRALMQRPAG